MAIDFTRYQPPGVYAENVGAPQLAVRSSVPTAVALFGQAIGYRTFRESIKINPDVDEETPALNKTLTQKGIRIPHDADAVASTNVDINSPGTTIGGVTLVSGNIVRLSAQTVATDNGLWIWRGATTRMVRYTTTFTVVDPNTGQVFALGTDYVITRISAGGDGETETRDDTYTVQRVIDGGHINPGDTVQVSYHYTDPDYFEVYSFYDYDDVRDMYGEPFDSSGNIQSELALCAKFAFLNGASTVLTCAVDPEDPNNVTMADYSNALDKFRDEEQIAVIVPCTGAQAIQQLVLQHVTAQSNNKFERRAIIGMDGSLAPVQTSTRIANAQAMGTNGGERIALISPSSFTYYAPELNAPIVVGGQYMAAAVAGKSVSMIASMPLTKKSISGFVGPAETQREGEKNRESSEGLMVVEKTRRQQVQVRHGVTTNPSDLHTREWSIIGQSDVMVYRIRDYLEADGLIGMPIYDSTIVQVKASAEAALTALVRDEVIRGYQELKARQISTMPDVIEVRFEWRPAYPLNYIVVRYSIAVETGDITVNTDGTTTTTG